MSIPNKAISGINYHSASQTNSCKWHINLLVQSISAEQKRKPELSVWTIDNLRHVCQEQNYPSTTEILLKLLFGNIWKITNGKSNATIFGDTAKTRNM